MYLTFQIQAASLASFIDHWSTKYSYPDEYKYTQNIGEQPTEASLLQLFEWKNGTGSVISARKLKSISDNYPVTFRGNKRERYLDHTKPGGAIWNIFFIHCLEPEVWPIFDQHTFRAMHYMQTGSIVEIGTTNKQKYEAYETRYIPFLASLGMPDSRSMDRALFTFGQFLKVAANYL